MNGQVNPSVAEARRAGRGGPHSRPGGAGPAPADVLSLQHRHPLERWLARRSFRWLLGRLSAPCAEGTPLEGILASYGRSDLPLSLRIRHWPFHKFIDRMRGQVTRETFQRRLAGYAPALRGLVIAARSVARFGLTCPQRFVAPLFAVWNITNRCNLRCRHCYQNSDAHPPTGELSARQRLAVVDKLGSAYVPMLAVAGGEPTACPDLLEVLRRAANHKMHTSIATNGTTMTERLAADLAAAQVRYVEVSLDSVDPARHDAFRGVPGMWERAVRGARIVARTPGLRLGIAMCVHRGNLAEVADMIEFAISLGAGCFAHFNFIPVGRGLKMVSGEITPQQREQLLETLNRYMQSGRIGVISTAPQLGRTCLMRAGEAGRTACSHAGSGSGFKARVVAKYLGGCGAGRTYICIQPNGDATPCVYLPHRVIGNLLAAGVEEVFRNGYYDLLNDRTSRLHHCRVCDFANYCGGCRARSDAYFGRLDAGDPGCIFNQEQWDQLVASGVINPQDADAPPEKMNITPTLHGPA